MRSSFLLLLLLRSIATAPAHAAAPASGPVVASADDRGAPPATPAADLDVLGAGDQVEVRVPGQKDVLPRRLDENGAIDLGDLGVVVIGGLPEAMAELALREHLRDYLRSVEGVALVWKTRGRMIVVTGLVRKPGRVVLEGQGDLWRAIHDAGGPEQAADLSRVTLLRAEQRFVVDVRAYLTGDVPPVLPALRAGDTVLVPALPGWGGADAALPTPSYLERQVLVLGAVMRQGPVPLEGPFDPLVALALAGGARPDASLADARVEAAGVKTRVDLAARLRGQPAAPLPDLTGPIVLYVPATGASADVRALRAVRVIGEVKTPGMILVDGRADLIEVLARAGGPSEKADLSRVEVLRRGRGATMSLLIDVRARLREDGGAGEVGPGDVVIVPSRSEDAVATGLQVLSQLAIIASVVALLTSALGVMP